MASTMFFDRAKEKPPEGGLAAVAFLFLPQFFNMVEQRQFFVFRQSTSRFGHYLTPGSLAIPYPAG
jgi:hypothetical protein